MPSQEYYSSLSDLVRVESIPGDFGALEDLAQSGLDLLIKKIWYKNLAVDVSPTGDIKHYNLELLLKKMSLPLIGSGLNLVFFRDSTGTLSSFPIVFIWAWPIQKHIEGLIDEGFSYAPEAFVDILFELAEIEDEKEFFSSIISVFLNDGNNSYQDFFTAFISQINVYDNGEPAVTSEITNIITQIGIIEIEVTSLLTNTSLFTVKGIFETYKNNTVLLNAVESIKTSIDLLEYNELIEIELFNDIIQSLLVDIADLNEKFSRLERLFKNWMADINKEDFFNLLVPQFSLELNDISMSLEFPRKWLIPALESPASSGIYIEDPDTNKLAALDFTVGDLKFSTQKGFEFEKQSAFTFERAFIGKTGIMLAFSNLKVDMSKSYNIPEADADGRPEDFQGVYCETATVTLPEKWFKNQTPGMTAEVFGKNLLIGTGGVYGVLGLEAVGGYDILWANIGDNGFRVGFESFDIQFKQNKVISSNIRGAMEIPKFVYPDGTPNAGDIVRIGIEGHIHDNGDFNLTASTEPPYPIELEDVFIYHIKSLELGKQEDDFFIGTSGKIEFQGFLKDTLKLKEIEVDRLRIYSDGSIEFEGGSIALVEPIVLALGPVEITVSAIHYGSHQKEVNGVMRKFNYFGFDGGISVDPLGLEIRGDGVKFYYCTDDLPNRPDSYLHIQTLYLDLTIPSSTPVAIINGWLSIPEPGESKEYAGGIKLSLPQANITGSADMKLMPKYPAFIIDASIELPAPIPLGPVGIFGFRGLIGYRYVAEKEAAGLVSGVDSWYDYYKKPPRGIHVTKFNGPDRTTVAGTPFSIGAGASLGTSADNGTILNIKAMILLSIPSLFMIDGRAAVLSARLGLDDAGDPPFFAFIAVGDNSLELGFGADFKMPTSSGDILKLYADVQAGFFFNDSSKWYVNIGTKTNPVTARVLTLLTITSYVMLSAKGIEAGARGEFNFYRAYGPIKIHAWAYIEVGGKISFEKPQFGAFMAAGVGADIDIKIVSLYASFDILFGVEAPKPFLIYGEFKYCVKIKIAWVFKFKFCGDLAVSWEFNSSVDRSPINPMINSANIGTIEDRVKGVNMLSNETFDLAYLGATIPSNLPSSITKKVIPLDTYIDIKTEKGLIPGAIADIIGGVNNPPQRYSENVPPDKIINGKEVRQVTHVYSIESIAIKSWNPQTSSWQDYHPYKALYPADSTLDTLKIGQFQKSDGQYSTIRLLATTPFSYTEQGEPGWYIPEQYGITPASLFCEGEHEVSECANFLEKPLHQKYYCYDDNHMFYSNQVAFFLYNKTDEEFAGVTDEMNPFNFSQSISFNNTNILQMRLPTPSVDVSLKLTTHSQGVKIRYYAPLIDDTNPHIQYGNPNPLATNQNEPYEVFISSGDLNIPVVYTHPEWRAVTRIEILPQYPNSDLIEQLQEQIAVIQNNNNLIQLDLIQGEIQSTTELENRLLKLITTGCSIIKEGNKCEQDEKLCLVWNKVFDIRNNCLPHPTLFDKKLLKQYIDCFKELLELLKDLSNKDLEVKFKSKIEFIKRFLKEPTQENYQISWNAVNCILELLLKAGNCDCKKEDKNCHTLLHEVCWLSLESYQFNLNIPGQAAIESDALATVAGITQYIQPIWRPDTNYIVHFVLKDVVDNNVAGATPYPFTYGFSTAGPLGFFHEDENSTYGDLIDPNTGNTIEDANGIVRNPSGTVIPQLPPLTPHPEKYALTSLRQYIDYKRSYPNADGNLLSAKPLFYNDETTQVYLFFTKAYSTHFFQEWQEYNGKTILKGRIKIVIKDPREDALIENPPYLDFDPADTVFTHIPQAVELWQDDPEPLLPHVFDQYSNLIENNNCIATGGDAIKPKSSFLAVTPKHLKPLKLYTAIVNNLYDLNNDGVLEDINGVLVDQKESKEVHKFLFQTSRYASFKEQVESYILTDHDPVNPITKKAVFEIKKAFSAMEIQAAYDTIVGDTNSMSDGLITNYQHDFDRVIEGILGFTPLDSAISTEFNLVKDTNNADNIIAIIIRNPEPFNNPKIPVTEISNTIQVLDSGGLIDTTYSILFSKDYSQAILMKTGLSINSGLFDFKFQYKIWDGLNYIVPSSPEYSSDEVGTILIENLDLQ